jgi:geranylgeranyl diphosphate synthase type II
MNLPGKRIRPVFVLQVLEMYRNPGLSDARVSLATELFHNFSLVHDDIMDKADLRRGFLTLHKKWDEPTAILAGDALLVLAYDALLESGLQDIRPLLHSFNRMSLAVCEGQQLDMDFSKMEKVDLDFYLDMIDRKTAALIAFSFELGGFLGNASAQDRQMLHDFGLAMGRCFQLRDDWLDLFGDEKVTGKKRGGDIGNFKLSHPVLVSMMQSDSDDFLQLWNGMEMHPEIRIQAVLKWMENAAVPAKCIDFLNIEMEKGLNLLRRLSIQNHEAKEQLITLCRELAFRDK